MTRDEMVKAAATLKGAPYDPEDRSDQAILFLIASLDCGPNYSKIHDATGIPMLTCQQFAMVARGVAPKSKPPLWVGRKMMYGGWDHPEHGGVAVLMDSMVLTEMLERH